MEITISKKDFESAMPVGMSAGDNVYGAVLPAIDDAMAALRRDVLGPEGMTALEAYGADSFPVRLCKKLASLDGLLAVLRQLDLVLTPTGFGVVSNENVAPASQARVDALEAQLRTQRDRELAVLVNYIRSEEWGWTPQARRLLPTVYDGAAFFYGTHYGATHEEWAAMQGAIADTDEALRAEMGDAQMDDIVGAFRRNDQNRMKAYSEVVALILRITDTWARIGREALDGPAVRRLIRIIDDDANQELFKLYRDSTNYRANHYDTYRNSKHATAFVFNG